MKDEIIQRLNVVLNALDKISVSGKVNLANLSGSIAMLEEIGMILNDAEVTSTLKKSDA
jgi:Tfp pilus assembly protein PilZ